MWIFIAMGTFVLFVPCLVIYCVGYAKEHGILRALFVFFRELLFGW